MKYNLNDLHWQEFEKLSFKCLQYLVSNSVEFIEGGSDKGRDMQFKGKSSSFKKEWSKGNWIFQAKHKSDIKKSTAQLKSDLADELKKVFITNKFDYDYYVLVTNVPTSSTLIDTLNNLVDNFIINHQVKTFQFAILGYRHIESCIDDYDSLKWNFVNVISHPDFQVLIEKQFSKGINNRMKAWLKHVDKTKNYFVNTGFYTKAIEKLKENNIIILSGPPKSGKTFNAEIIGYNYSLQEGQEIIIVYKPEDVESYYNENRKQLFICDDAFGKHQLSSNHNEWFRTLLTIFSLVDDNHKFIFTSREYIYRGFANLMDEDLNEFLNKILVESHNYSIQEKNALLHRYTIKSNLGLHNKKLILESLKTLTKHKNFSPETIRAFFSNLPNSLTGKNILTLIKVHLNAPDTYLSKVFNNLSEMRKASVLSVLCALFNKFEEISFCYTKICNDLNINSLRTPELEFNELDDSILRILENDGSQVVKFYHPSMQEFLIKEVTKNPHSNLKNTVIKNINIGILRLCFFKPNSIKIKKQKNQYENKSVFRPFLPLTTEDFANFKVGIFRVINNSRVTLRYYVEVFSWYNSEDNSIYLKLNDFKFYSEVKSIFQVLTSTLSKWNFFEKHKAESVSDWSDLLRSIGRLYTTMGIAINEDFMPYQLQLLKMKKDDSEYWKLVFRLLNESNANLLFSEIGKDWFNDFFSSTNNQISRLGNQAYGEDFPEFKIYKEKLKKNGGHVKEKNKLNKFWYPTFLEVQEKMKILKEVQGTDIGQKILTRLEKNYGIVVKLETHARKRHYFIVGKGWWKDV